MLNERTEAICLYFRSLIPPLLVVDMHFSGKQTGAFPETKTTA